MFLPHYDTLTVSITEQTMAKYLLVLYNKKVKVFTKIGFVARQKDFHTPFDVITIRTKQSTPLVVNNSVMAMIGL